jgi:cell volume regulation protein A
VEAGSPADGAPVAELPLGEHFWISAVSRGGELVQVRGDTVLRAGDEVLALADADRTDLPAALFTAAPPD